MTCDKKIKSKTKPCLHYNPNPDTPVGKCSAPGEFGLCIEAIKKHPLPISHSSLHKFISCRMSYYLSKIKGVTTKAHKLSDPVKMGILIDEYLNPNKKESSHEKLYPDSNSFSYRKVLATIRAIKMLEIFPTIPKPVGTQVKVEIKIDEGQVVTGVIDRLYPDHFVETKYSSSDYYTKKQFIKSQVATYFLVDEGLKYVIMEIIKPPALKSTRQFKEETADEYEERCYQAMLTKPSAFFHKYDKENKNFGVVFERSEFDFDKIIERYKQVLKEIRVATEDNAFYENEDSCLQPFECEYLPICETGWISDSLYEKRF